MTSNHLFWLLDQKINIGSSMDYIRQFDIRLEKEMYYAGETLAGHVILDTLENFKLKGTFLHNKIPFN